MARRLIVLSLCLGLVLGVAQVVQATIEPPVVTMTMPPPGMPDRGLPNLTFNAPMTLVAGNWSLPTVTFFNGYERTMELAISTNITPTDPMINWSMNLFSVGDPMGTFSFSVRIPIFLPPGLPTVVESSVGGTLTEGCGNNFLKGVNPSGFLQDATLVSAGFTSSVGLEGWVGLDPPSLPYGPFVLGPEAGPLGTGLDYLFISVLGTAGEGPITLTGFTSIETDPVPLPSNVFLLGSGLGFLAIYGRRRLVWRE